MIKLGSNSIGKIYLGSNSIGKAYLGSNLVFQNGGQPAQLIPYIRGGADGSYIDTGITPDNTTRIVLWARNVNPGTAFNWVFGSRVANQNAAFALAIRNEGGTDGIRAGFGNENVNLTDKWSLLSHYHKYELSVSGFYVDDVLAGGVTSSTFSNNYNLYLFGLNNAGSYYALGLRADICACKIYKNNVLVRDFTAVETPSVGLYDAISDTVFTNAGTGSFTYGSFNPNAYTPLAYIESNGSSYIQTEIQATYSMPAVACFMPTGTVVQFYRFLGARDESPTNMFEFATGNATYRNARLYLNFGTEASTAYTSNTNDYFKNKKIVAVKNNNVMSAYVDNSQVGDTITGTTDTSFTVTQKLQIFRSNGAGDGSMFIGRGYYVLLGESCFVPAKKGNRVGMYDTYNDTFYESKTSTPFTAGPIISTQPVFYDRLVFDGTAYIDTDITPADNSSFNVRAGEETIKGTQNFFMIPAGSGRIGAWYSTSTTQTSRYISVYYDSSSIIGSGNELNFSFNSFNFFLTPKAYGWGSTSFTITKDSFAPSGPLVLGGSFSHAGQQYTGVMGTFYIYGSDAQNVTNSSDFSSFTPTYTLRPCAYNGEAGFWCVETSKFYGNTAGAGTLTVKNV